MRFYDEPVNIPYQCQGLPTLIKILTEPRKLAYADGETIDLTGIVVKAYMEEDMPWHSEDYPTGIIPSNELRANPSTASYVKNPLDEYKDYYLRTAKGNLYVLNLHTPYNLSTDRLGWWISGSDVTYKGEYLNTNPRMQASIPRYATYRKEESAAVGTVSLTDITGGYIEETGNNSTRHIFYCNYTLTGGFYTYEFGNHSGNRDFSVYFILWDDYNNAMVGTEMVSIPENSWYSFTGNTSSTYGYLDAVFGDFFSQYNEGTHLERDFSHSELYAALEEVSPQQTITVEWDRPDDHVTLTDAFDISVG